MAETPRVPRSKAEADPRRWVALFILLLASFMNLIDVTIVNVALPSLQKNLGASSAQIEWVSAGFILAFALGLLPFGRLGDIVGRTRMFLIGVGAFTLGSALCGIAPSIEFLLAARVLQGLAGAVMTPQVLAIAQVTFPPEERGQAFSLFGFSAGLASVAGPIVGGLLIGADLWGLDWRPIFLVNVPVGIIAVIAGFILIPRMPGHAGLNNDLGGIGLFALAMLALVYPLVEGRDYGWPMWVWGLLILAAVLLVAFYLWERRRAAAGQSQLLNLELIHNGNFMLGVLITTIFSSGIPGFFLAVSIALQAGFGLTPLQSGLVNTPFSAGVLIVSLISGRFGQRHLKGRLATSAALLTVGMVWVHFIFGSFTDEVNRMLLLPPLFISGMGLGLGFSALFQSILAGVPPRDAGSASGALQAFQQVGGALGVALVGQIFFASLAGASASGPPHPADFAQSAANATWYLVVAFLFVLVLTPLLRIRTTGQPSPDAQPVIVEA